MSKKLTFLFVAIFILTLVLSSYFVIQKVRGLAIRTNVDMSYNNIINLPLPTADDQPFIKEHLHHVGPLSANDGSIESWCEIKHSWWCDYGYPETWCGDGICNEPFIDCPEDCGGFCFVPETPILMADGSYKPIKDVKEGDWILTKENEESDKMVSAKVVKASKHTVDNYLVINNELGVTGNHPIFISGVVKNWKPARTIKLVNKLLNEKGQEVAVESLEIKRETIEVYNFVVEGYKTYFAGGFYVHNKEPENGFVP